MGQSGMQVFLAEAPEIEFCSGSASRSENQLDLLQLSLLLVAEVCLG